LGDSASERTAVVTQRVGQLLEEAAVTLKHLKVKEAIEQATINYRTEILRDALVGGVSHELRTPLAAIVGSCSVPEDTPSILNDPRSHALVKAIMTKPASLTARFATCSTRRGLAPKGSVHN
jgi:K+-sensing histidine kinase KdpD